MKKIVRCVLLLTICLLAGGCGAKETAAEPKTEAVTADGSSEESAEGSSLEEASTEEAAAETPGEADAVNTQEVAKVVEDKQNEVKTAADTDNMDAKDTATVSENTIEEEITVTPFETAKTMYATIALNVRKGPSTDYEVVGHLAMAQAAEVTGQADTGWYQITMDGKNVFVSHRYMSETKVEVPASQPVADAAAQPAANAQTPAPAQPAATVAPAGVIMVGDSRCVQMQAAVGGGGCSWICENSKEYTWFVNTAIPKFDQYVGNGTKVVINMGVNDPEHYKDYVATINAKAAEWAQRGAKTYLVSVNPVWENPYTTQEQVDTFNANVPGMLAGVTWIDTSSWLTTNGYRVLDGLHYDDPTYVNIFNLIMGSL